MSSEFDARFSGAEDFDAKEETNLDVDAMFEDAETFGASLDENEETFTSSFGDESQLNADFGLHQMIDPSKVTSVNGMVGDVQIHIPTLVSELENDMDYVTEPQLVPLTNLELEALLT